MKIFLVIIPVIGLILPSVVPAGEESIVLRYDFNPPRFEAEGRYFGVTMADLPLMQNAGQPALPYKSLRVLIPRGREVQNIEIEEGEKVTLEGSYMIRPALQPVPLSYQGEPVSTSLDREIYDSLAPFPPEMQSDVSIQQKGPYRVLLLNIHPVSYVPATGKISYYTSLTVKVRLEPAMERFARGAARRPVPEDTASIGRRVENPASLSSYLSGEIDTGDEGDGEPLLKSGPLGDYPHVIITSQALADAGGAFTFSDLVNHRATRGMNSTIVTTEYIYANFDGTRPDGGTDNQTRIRNFVSWARDNWGTEYVLLGGYSGIIPVRYLNADGTNIPADMYYGNLDGTFDNDGDGIYGEPTDGVDGGEVDLYADIYIGRACVENESDVSSFVMKTIAYETSTADYLHRACMVGEHLGFGGDSEYAKPSMEEIRLGSSAHGYVTKGFAEDAFFETSKLYDQDGTWAKSQLISIINEGIHVLNHLGHAGYTYDMKLNTSDLPSLTNTDYFFAYSQGCMPGGFDTSNCFAEVVTTMEHGAFAAVLNARYGWGTYNSTAGPSQYYDREFWDALFGEGIKALGRMNADSKEDNDLRINGSRMRWCFYELNLFGDPATEIKNISSNGTVSFSADAYALPGTATVTVMDLDLDTDPGSPDTVTVAVSSNTETTPESLLLTETGDSTKIFRASIPIAQGTPAHGDGTLQVDDGDIMTVVYHDEDDGTGSPATVQDTALADCSGPVITNIQFTPSVTSCTITWTTNEQSGSLVRHGELKPPSTETNDSTLTASHSLRIRGLQPLTTYYFEVASSDGVGNSTTNDNGGSYYQFTTPERGAILFVDDDEGDSYESYFTSALDTGSYSYDVWDVSQEGSSPTLDDLDDYQVVIWNCGAEWRNSTSGLTTSEENALSSYMDGGGNVFLCGQDILYNGVSSAFSTDYLHLANRDSDDQTNEANGIDGDRISDSMSLSLSYPFSNYSDSLDPDSASSGVFLTDDSTTYPCCATRYPSDGVSGPFRIVFFAFPFEAISSTGNDPDNAETVMDRALQFLSPIEIDGITPSYGLNDRQTDITICGSNLNPGLTASIGGVPLNVSSTLGTEVSATLPAGLVPGVHDSTAQNSDSLRACLHGSYTSLDPAADDDQDGLTNKDEVLTSGTNPLLADTDDDKLSDYDELSVYNTDPLDADTDHDGLPDGSEIQNGCDPTLPDSDNDGYTDFVEVMCGSSPTDGIPPATICINFQPISSGKPPGYAPDDGNAYNGCGFGWR
ncbi:MAG: C25 family cysteine peptidase [Candidatus Tritonobacter lacicola]|nr:C25 family cysteine peptidase [Candidatus Tritonobacter lacicola]